MGALCGKLSSKDDNFAGQGRTLDSAPPQAPTAPLPANKRVVGGPARTLGAGSSSAAGDDDPRAAARRAAEVREEMKDDDTLLLPWVGVSNLNFMRLISVICIATRSSCKGQGWEIGPAAAAAEGNDG